MAPVMEPAAGVHDSILETIGETPMVAVEPPPKHCRQGLRNMTESRYPREPDPA